MAHTNVAFVNSQGITSKILTAQVYCSDGFIIYNHTLELSCFREVEHIGRLAQLIEDLSGRMAHHLCLLITQQAHLQNLFTIRICRANLFQQIMGPWESLNSVDLFLSTSVSDVMFKENRPKSHNYYSSTLAQDSMVHVLSVDVHWGQGSPSCSEGHLDTVSPLFSN